MEATGGSGPSACRYDVFLSFRGPDTRNNFTDCLYRTMVGQGIVAYMDSEELHAGDRIDDLLRVIGNSKICIPVFSRGYASSAWCLRELARMMDLNQSTGKPAILPIFFDVTPLDVKLRTKVYGDDMEKHEQRHGKEIRQQWEAALSKVTEIKGHEVQGKKYGEVIEFVVKEILRKLKVKQRHLDEKMVGVDEQVESIMELLDVDSGTSVLFVGIYGMGGIGKTTLAKIVFNKLCSHFDGRCSFIENIRESSTGNSLVDLQKKLVSDISDSRFVENFITTEEGIDSIRRRASSKKVLLVLDNLDKKEQLKKLVGGPENFGSGSRIIITTRDKRIMDEENEILTFEVKQMDSDKALKLFSLHAFNRVSPLDAYQSLSQEVVFMAGGLPLALEVIGSSLRGKDEKKWKAMLEKLKKVPHKYVRDKLKLSYDALEDMEKEIFLDIACFFIRENKSTATYFWHACNLSPDITLEELMDLCLIKIVDDDVIWMHDQLRDLGRDIVREECTRNPIGRSRLWNYEEALEVVKSKERKDKPQALNLVEHHSNSISIVDEELERMPNLNFLELRAGTFVGDVSNYLQKLRWFSWYCPPRPDHTLAKLHLKNLVVFRLSNNQNTEDWGGWNILKMENKLKVLSLIWCDGLKRTPDFSGCRSLEELSIDHCSNLQEVDPSIGKLQGLTRLNIQYCERLQNLPEEIGGLVNIEYFHIAHCEALETLPLSIFKFASLSELRLDGTQITCLPDSIGELMRLEYLGLYGCNKLRELPESIGNLTSLQKLHIAETIIAELPHTIQNLKQLKVLRMEGTRIRRLPVGIGTLERLEVLNANNCKLAGELPSEIGGLSSLCILDISSTCVCAVPTTIISLTRLQKLDLMCCDELEELPKLPPSLTHLRVRSKSLRLVADLSNLTNLVELILSTGLGPPCAQESSPMQTLQLQDIGKLSKLEKLTSHFPVPPTELGRLTRLTDLILSDVDSVTVGSQFPNLKYLSKLTLEGSRLREMQLAGLELLRELKVSCFDLLEGLSFMPSSLRKIRKIYVKVCPRLLEIRFLGVMMESLEELSFVFCKSLTALRGLSNAKELQKLNIFGCEQLEVVEGLEGLYFGECGSLVGLTDVSSNSKIPKNCRIKVQVCAKLSNYEGTCEDYRERVKKVLKFVRMPIVELPISIGELMQLEFLELTFCENLRELPESIGNLISLQELHINETIIVELPDSIQNLKQLKVLKIRRTPIVELPVSIGELKQLEFLELVICEKLRELPESIGNLTSIQKLDISDTIIDELPVSIQNLKQLKVLKMGRTQIRRLPAGIGMLERLEELYAPGCEQLVGELPTEIGGLSSLSILDISRTRVCAVPMTIISLTRLQKLNLMDCNELQELPKLPPSLTCLRAQARSLRLVPDLNYLTNLKELTLSTGFGSARAWANPMQTLQLQWIGELSKLTSSLDAPAPPLELGRLTRFTDLTLSGMDSFDSVTVGPQFSNLKYLSSLTLCYSPLREMQLDGLELLSQLHVRGSDLLEGLSFMPSCLKSILAISICECPRLLEIRFLGAMMESLDSLQIDNLNSLAGLRGLSNAEKLRSLRISGCNELQVVEGLEGLCISECGPLEGLTDVSSNNSIIPYRCGINVECCAKLSEYKGTYGNYREMIKKKDAMESDSDNRKRKRTVLFDP